MKNKRKIEDIFVLIQQFLGNGWTYSNFDFTTKNKLKCGKCSATLIERFPKEKR